METLIQNAKVSRVMNAVSAGTSDTNSSSLDMKGWDSVLFIASFGTLSTGAVTSIFAQQSSDDGSSDAWTALKGTRVSIAEADDNKVLLLEVAKPRERYVRCSVDRGTGNAVIDNIVALQYNLTGTIAPVTQDTTVAASEVHHAPVEGTA